VNHLITPVLPLLHHPHHQALLPATETGTLPVHHHHHLAQLTIPAQDSSSKKEVISEETSNRKFDSPT